MANSRRITPQATIISPNMTGIHPIHNGGYVPNTSSAVNPYQIPVATATPVNPGYSLQTEACWQKPKAFSHCICPR